MKKGFINVLLLILLITVSIAFAYYYGTQQQNTTSSAESKSQENISKTVSTAPSSTLVPVPTSTLPSGWNTYRNEKYGFEISYPSTYKALDDANNLYGYPSGIVLIYGGGQSYDLVIEHWDTQSDYENKYRNQPNLTVKEIGNYYISLLNTNLEDEVDEIIKTFKITSLGE